MAPDRTIAPSSFAGRTVQKAHFTLLVCCNADKTEKIPLIFNVNAKKPRSFKKKTGEEWVLYYKHNKRSG